MKFIHVSDIHASRERLNSTLSILETLTKRSKQGDIDFIIFDGDFWHSTITATKGSGFSDIVAAKRKLENNTRLYFNYGTPAHEPAGSLDAFESSKTTVIDKMCCVNEKNCRIVFIPEPRRSEYVTNSVQATTDLINSTIENWIENTKKWHEETKEYLPVLDTYEYDKPLIVAYHGEIKGAVYQNGTSASSPTAISKELLQSLNANYYALGHIHLPQEVFPNAWYSGSACPVNFGETHDGHYNLVTIENGKTKVEQVSFGLPTYVTYDIAYSDFARIVGNFSNKHIRLRFNCTKEERKTLDIKALIDDIKERTHAITVKIEPNIIEAESVQTSEVVKCKSLVEKMMAYAEEKGLKIPNYAKELLQDIQDGTLNELTFPQHSFELLSLSLRGAVGIKDGQGKEDFELNFEQYEDGVICLCGECGKGKSTILENCHPYPKMLTRKGVLQEHFYLKDSHRILVYKDETGLFYRISILIDGKTVNGKVSYFVETSKDREVWHSVPDVDGSSEAYKEWVNHTFGSVDIYLRTAFFAKEPTKDATDISDTTKGERMEFLSKLAGTEQLKEVSEIAKNLRSGSKTKKIIGLEESAEALKKEIDACSKIAETVEKDKQDIKAWKNKLKAQKEAILVTQKEIADLKKIDAEYQKSVAVVESNRALYDQYQKQKENLESELRDLASAIGCYNEVSQIKEKKRLLAESNKKIPVLQKDIASKKKELEPIKNEITSVTKEREQKLKKFNKLDIDIKLLKQQIVPISDICPTCGGKLSAEKYAELSSVVKENESKFHQLVAEQNDYVVPEADKDTVLVSLVNKKTSLEDEISTLDCDVIGLIDTVTDCNNFLEQWSDLEQFADKSKDELEVESETHKAQIQELEAKLEDLVYESCVQDVSEKLKEAEDKLNREINNRAELMASIKSAENEIERYEHDLEFVEDKKKQLKVIQDKIIAYNFIEEAFSNKGIPAIELRESAPEIANIANKILKDSYGNKFEIRFGPSSELKAKRKVDEDFNIIVTDTENFDEKTIDLVSSGERIWIKQALFYAFSIVQMNRTGFNFRTRLIDESDGSLDGTLRPKYLKMVEAAHKYACSRITLLITHSQEIKDIAQQIIEI